MSSGQLEDSGGPRPFWGRAAGIGVLFSGFVVAVPTSVVNGALHIGREGGFKQGAYDVFDAVSDLTDKAGEFGGRHNDAITRAVINGAGGALGGGLVKGLFRATRR